MISFLEDFEDCYAVEQALIDYEKGTTVLGVVVDAILNGESPLRAWRENRGFTLDSLAKRVGVSKSFFSQIENNRKPGSLNLYRRISTVLNVAVDDLVYWTEGNT